MAVAALVSNAALILAAAGPAQQQQQPPPPRPPQQAQGQETRAPVEMFLSGRVLMADGSDLPVETQVYLMCDGAIRRQTHVIGDGDFSFSLSDGPTEGVLDASVSGSESGIFGPENGSMGSANQTMSRRLQTMSPMRRVNLHGCSLQAYVPGFRSSVLHLGSRSILDKPHVGDLFLEPLVKADATTVSATRLAAPRKAVKAYEKAVKEFGRQKYTKAAKEAGKAVEFYPEYAEAWQLLGASRNALHDGGGAEQAFRTALEVDPSFLPPMVALSRIDVKAGRFEEAATLSGRVIEAVPTLYDAYYIHSLSHYNLGNLDTALESAQRYFDRPDAVAPTAHLLMGFVRAERGEFLEAAGAFEQYLTMVPEGAASDHARQQLEEWRRRGLLP